MDPFVSYAQNFEDVMLWRALKQVEQGFYVDVGANDPKIESVTQAFYERDWHGINIEPMREYYEALCRERPKDINLSLAAAASEGEITLYEVPETGLSSAIAEFVESEKVTARSVVKRTVLALPLNKILEEYAREPIHFLKIDVEGFEAEVVRGLDLSRWRPWIVVVEATIPNSTEANYDSWEPMLLAGAYTFVYFDGLNRFYVANEHMELAASFAAPPNFFDHFITFEHAAAFQQIAWQESVIKGLDEKQKELPALRSELEWARNDLSYLRAEVIHARKELDRLQAQHERDLSRLHAQHELDLSRLHAQHELDEKELNLARLETENIRKEYINVLYSRSYRITAPMRAFYGLAGRLRRNPITRVTSQNPNAQVQQMDAPSDLAVDKVYFLNFFQREINKRRKS